MTRQLVPVLLLHFVSNTLVCLMTLLSYYNVIGDELAKEWCISVVNFLNAIFYLLIQYMVIR